MERCLIVERGALSGYCVIAAGDFNVAVRLPTQARSSTKAARSR